MSTGRRERVRSKLQKLVEEFINDLLDITESAFCSHSKGMKWEARFRSMCRDRQLHVSKDLAGRHDLEVSGRKVQCKSIDQVMNGTVAIDNMRPVKANAGERGYRVDEFDVLALHCDGDVYLIPVAVLHDQSRPGYVRARLQVSEYQHCIDAWDVFSGHIPLPQHRLFDDFASDS